MFILMVGDHGGPTAQIERELAELGLNWRAIWLDDTGATPSLPGQIVPDVVVCAGRAEASNGSALLGLLRQFRMHYPRAARIAVVDASRELEAMLALDVANQVLPRPLTTPALVEAIVSVTELHALLDDPALMHAIARVGSLPAAPDQYLALTRLLREPNISAARVADELGQDPAVAARVLRMSNSAYYSAGREIGDLRTAVTRLGHNALRRLVLASEVFSANANGADLDAMRDRALQTSHLAGQLLVGSSAEMAATAGLLAEIGLLLPPLDCIDGSGAAPSHCIAGAYLLGLWGLPTPIVQAVAFHQRPGHIRGPFSLIGAVHVAAALVNGSAVDEEYLSTVGQLDRLPRWRQIARSLADAG